MAWQTLVPLSVSAFLCVPAIRGLCAVRALENRVPLQPQRLNLSRSLHRPLYIASLCVMALRSAFFLLSAVHDANQRDSAVKVADFWLMDMPSVALVGLSSYFVLFAVRLAFRRRWPRVFNGRDSNGLLTAVFVAFCASLTALTTLVAVCRADSGGWGFTIPQWMMLGYSAVIWSTLGGLLLKYGGQAVQILWRHRRYRWSVSDEAEKMRSRLLPVLSIKCLRNFAVCSTLLAELLITRGVVCVLMVMQHRVQQVDHAEFHSWRSVMLHYFSWEVVCIVIVLRMLHQTPVAVHSLTEELANLEQSNEVSKNGIVLATHCGDDIQVQFRMPTASDLVSDYVVPANISLLLGQQMYAGSGYGEDDDLVHRYCSVHHNVMLSEGSEYVVCRCHQERNTGQFLSNAKVPLLADDYDPVSGEAFVGDTTATASTEEEI